MRIQGIIFSARPGGNLHDLARHLFAGVEAKLPDAQIELIETWQRKISPCNGCRYECLLGPTPGQACPIEDDVPDLWRAALSSDLVVYFLPTYGGLPPATWVAFQQRYHAMFRRPEATSRPNGKTAALTLYDPIGSTKGDLSQATVLHTLSGARRPLISFEQIIPSNYGLNSLRDRLIAHEAVRDRLKIMSGRIVEELRASQL